MVPWAAVPATYAAGVVVTEMAQASPGGDLFLQYGALGVLALCMVLLITRVIGRLDQIAEKLTVYAEAAAKAASSGSELAIAIDELRISTVAQAATEQTVVQLVDRMQHQAHTDSQAVHKRQEEILRLLRAKAQTRTTRTTRTKR